MNQRYSSELVTSLSFATHPLSFFLNQQSSVFPTRDFGWQARKVAINAVLNTRQPRFDHVNRGGDHG